MGLDAGVLLPAFPVAATAIMVDSEFVVLLLHLLHLITKMVNYVFELVPVMLSSISLPERFSLDLNQFFNDESVVLFILLAL